MQHNKTNKMFFTTISFRALAQYLCSALAGLATCCLTFIVLLSIYLWLSLEIDYFEYAIVLVSFISGLQAFIMALRIVRNGSIFLFFAVGSISSALIMGFVFLSSYIVNKDINYRYNELPLAQSPPPLSTKPSFPSKLPQASARELIPLEVLFGHNHFLPRTLGHLNLHIVNALRHIGHTELSYFWIPSGYVLVTRLEKINSDGSPKSEPERWETKLDSTTELSVERILRTLFTANKGYYRIIVFIISSNALTESTDKILEEEAIMWLRQGADRLPRELAKMRLSDGHECTALIYEFEQVDTKTLPHFISPGKIPAHNHLEASGFYKALGG